MFYFAAIAFVFARIILPDLKDVDVNDGEDAGGAGVFQKIDALWVTKRKNEYEGRENDGEWTIHVEDLTKVFVVTPKEAIKLVA